MKLAALPCLVPSDSRVSVGWDTCFPEWLLHKAVSETLLRDLGDGRRGAGCNDLGAEAPPVTDAMGDFGTHP